MGPKTVKDGYDKMHAHFARLRAMKAAKRLRRWALRAYYGSHIDRDTLVTTNKTIGRRHT